MHQIGGYRDVLCWESRMERFEVIGNLFADGFRCSSEYFERKVFS